MLEGVCVKKPRGDSIICKHLQDIWLHTEREDGGNTSGLRPLLRNRRNYNDAIWKHKSKILLTGL